MALVARYNGQSQEDSWEQLSVNVLCRSKSSTELMLFASKSDVK